MSSDQTDDQTNFEMSVPTTIWTKAFITLFFSNMVFNFGISTSNTLLALYLRSLGASASTIGLVTGSFAISAVLLRLVAAPIMDVYNRKYLIMIAACIMSTVFFGYSISVTIPMVTAFRILHGCGLAFGNASSLAMVSEMLPRDQYNKGIGYYSLAQVVTNAIGPTIGLMMVDEVGFRITYTIIAALTLTSVIMVSLLKTDFVRTKKLHFALRNSISREALMPMSLILILTAGGSSVGSFLVVFAREQGVTSNVGLYFTISAITMMVSRPYIGKLIDRYGLVKIMIPALLCNIVSYYIISFSAVLLGFLLAGFITAFGQGACQPAVQGLSLKSVPPDRRGAASSTMYIGQDIGSMIGPIISGRVAEAAGFISMWRIMSVVYIIAIVIVIGFRKTINKVESTFASQ